MKIKKRIMLACLILVICIISTVVFFFIKNDATSNEPVEIFYFHDTACGSCNGDQDIYDIVSEELTDMRDEYPYTVSSYNVFQSAAYKKFQEIQQEKGLNDITANFPLAIVGNNALVGLEMIESRIREYLLIAYEDKEKKIIASVENSLVAEDLFASFEVDKDENTLLYFYRITCPDCEMVRPTIEDIPKNVAVGTEKHKTNLLEFNSRSGKNGDRIRLLFEEYNIPSEDQVVPIVFFADSYLAGPEDINNYLNQYLSEGKGLNMQLP